MKFKDNEISFASALYDSNISNAADARDQVFELYGIYDRKVDDRIKSETEIYKHIAQYLLEEGQPLHLLSYVSVGFFDDKQEGRPYNERLPSWCLTGASSPR